MHLSKFLYHLVLSLIIFSLVGCAEDNDRDKPEKQQTSIPVAPSSAPEYGTQHINKPASDFSVDDLTGGKVKLSQHKGKVVLINFWATWCSPCVAEIPEFVDVYNDLSEKNFIIIGIALDQKDLVSKFVDKHKVTYPIAFGEDNVSKIAKKYGNSMGALPYNVILNREHKIVYAEPGTLPKEHLLSIIKPLL